MQLKNARETLAAALMTLVLGGLVAMTVVHIAQYCDVVFYPPHMPALQCLVNF